MISLILLPLNASCVLQDAASARKLISVIWTLTAFNEAFRPQWYHHRGSVGTLISCAAPCQRAPDGSDGRVLQYEGYSGKEIG
mmetsp:Transcript_36198/g.95395  ORF Transcript_36198/g.95395 Transcript_36198/m.95395 type:complete len:83 (-) Transcript_36198:14-262(-)